MANSNLKLPGWAQSAMTALLLISLGVNGTLLLIDRNNISKFIEKQELATSAIIKVINSQNRLFDRFCGLLTESHEQRLNSIKLYPLTRPEDIK